MDMTKLSTLSLHRMSAHTFHQWAILFMLMQPVTERALVLSQGREESAGTAQASAFT